MQRELAAAVARAVEDVVDDQRHVVEELDRGRRPEHARRGRAACVVAWWQAKTVTGRKYFARADIWRCTISRTSGSQSSIQSAMTVAQAVEVGGQAEQLGQLPGRALAACSASPGASRAPASCLRADWPRRPAADDERDPRPRRAAEC